MLVLVGLDSGFDLTELSGKGQLELLEILAELVADETPTDIMLSVPFEVVLSLTKRASAYPLVLSSKMSWRQLMNLHHTKVLAVSSALRAR